MPNEFSNKQYNEQIKKQIGAIELHKIYLLYTKMDQNILIVNYSADERVWWMGDYFAFFILNNGKLTLVTKGLFRRLFNESKLYSIEDELFIGVFKNGFIEFNSSIKEKNCKFDINAPSFNCEDASLTHEHVICQTEKLARLDSQMSELYFKSTNSNKKAAQRKWLKSLKTCKAPKLSGHIRENCLLKKYNERISELKS